MLGYYRMMGRHSKSYLHELHIERIWCSRLLKRSHWRSIVNYNQTEEQEGTRYVV